jgi:hypothetical protein
MITILGHFGNPMEVRGLPCVEDEFHNLHKGFNPQDRLQNLILGLEGLEEGDEVQYQGTPLCE